MFPAVCRSVVRVMRWGFSVGVDFAVWVEVIFGKNNVRRVVVDAVGAVVGLWVSPISEFFGVAVHTALCVLSGSSYDSCFSFISLSVGGMLPLIVEIISAASGSPFLLSLTLFRLNFTEVHPSTLGSLAMMTRKLITLCRYSTLTVIGSLLLSGVASSIALRSRSSYRRRWAVVLAGAGVPAVRVFFWIFFIS